MSNWRVVTGDDGKPYLEIDNVQVAVPRTYPTDGEVPPVFLAVTPPGGVANLPVGPKAPAWLQDMIESTTQFAKDAAMIACPPPQQGRAANPLTDTSPWNTSRWNLDTVQALRDSTWRGRGYTEYAKANPSYPRQGGKAGFRADYLAVDEAKRLAEDELYDEVVNFQGDVVRRDPVADTTATDDQPVKGDALYDAFPVARDALAGLGPAWTRSNPPYGSPAPKMDPNQDGLSVTVRRWLPGDPVPGQLQAAKVSGRMGTIGGFPFIGSPNAPAGGMFVGNPGGMFGVPWMASGGSWTVTDTPTPEPEPEPGRFQNLDWE